MKRQLRRLFSYDDPDSRVNRYRAARHRMFADILASVPGETVRVIDLGGSARYWDTQGIPDPRCAMTVVNTEPFGATDVTLASDSTVPMRLVRGDATCAPFESGSFDVVFSNSVIEHVGSRAAQERFVADVRRLGPVAFVQTPSRWFPLEPHTRLPLFSYLPRPLRALAIWKLHPHYYPWVDTWSEAVAATDTTILLTRRDMDELFPDATIVTERVLGMAKSYTAVLGADVPADRMS